MIATFGRAIPSSVQDMAEAPCSALGAPTVGARSDRSLARPLISVLLSRGDHIGVMASCGPNENSEREQNRLKSDTEIAQQQIACA